MQLQCLGSSGIAVMDDNAICGEKRTVEDGGQEGSLRKVSKVFKAYLPTCSGAYAIRYYLPRAVNEL